MLNNFKIKNRTAIITGGAGLLGSKHAEAVAEIGGIPVLIDIDDESLKNTKKSIDEKFNIETQIFNADITLETDLERIKEILLRKNKSIDILINNAALNPKVESKTGVEFSRLENFDLETWNKEISVGLTGAFLCSKVFGPEMAAQKEGVIINISSDLGIIAPDQRIYKDKNLLSNINPVKPITYSVIKHGIIGLTKYLATYWAKSGVRCNALCPGGIEQGQNQEFINKVSNLIPMGRMAEENEYKSAVQFLVSDASSYMNGSSLIIDGGRSCW